MDSDKYLEGQSMQRPPLFESDHFIYWKNRFETYVKAKDLDLWHIILNGDFPPVARNKETQVLEMVPFEQQDDDLKKKLAKNNEAKMVLYNALPKKEYERIFMCKTAKDIWQSLLITHQGNSQVKDNKIDLLVQQYEQFTILEEESIDSGFARFNTIITSLKALDEGFSSKNYVRKFLRALHPKWRAKVTAIEESKDLSSLALDELIGNLKVHEVVMEKDSKIYRGKKERVKSISLKAKKELVMMETSTSGKCGDPNNLIGDCPKPPRNKDQKAFIGGSWSDSENNAEEKTNDETCLMAQSLNESKGKISPTPPPTHVTFDESPPPIKLSPLVDDDVGEEEAIRNNTKVVNNNNEEHESIEVDEVINIKESKSHPLDQALYGLKQAPKAWYDRLKAFLIKHEYSMGMVDNTLFTKKSKSHLIIVQIHVDDIIFGFASQNVCDDFAKIMHDEFEMSMMEELNFFLGLKIKQMEDEIFFNQSKYIKEMLKKFRLEDSKPTKTPMSTEIKINKDDEAESVDSSKYQDTLSVLGKFDEKCDEGFLVGYSLNSKTFRVYNLVTKKVEVNLHVKFLEEKSNVKRVGYRWMFDIDYLTDSMNYIPVSLENQTNPHAGTPEVTNSTETLPTPNANASEEEDVAEELIVMPTAVKHTIAKKEAHSTGISEARTMTVEDLLHLVPNLITKVDSLETELKKTKLTMGKAIVKLVKKVKKLEAILKRRHVVLTDSEDEEPEDQGRIIQDIDDDPLGSKGDFVTPTKPLGEAQEEEISPTTLEAAKILSKVASQKSKSVDKGKRYKRRKESKGKDISTGFEEVNTGFEKVNTGGLGVSTGSGPVSSARGQRSHKIANSRGRGNSQHYTEEDWDAIRAKLEANAKLTKNVLGKELPEEDFAKKMVELVNQRKKFFAEERAKARRSKPMTQSLLRNYMMNYLKNQGTWKLTQLKKLSFEEVKEEFDKLVKQVEFFVPMNIEATKAQLKRYGEELQTEISKKQRIDDKDVSVEEKVTEVKEEEPVIRTGKRKKQKARKGINVDKSPQGDSETDEEESVEAMNPTPLDTKSNIVANWKIFQQGERSIYQIIRANGADTVYMSFGAMLKDFTREDLIELYRLVMQKYGTNRPEDVYDRVLWSDLRTMFDPPLNEDAIWSLPLQQKIISWRYYDKCEVHCLTLEACSIYMLADRKYPLSKDACQVMLKMKLLDGKMNEVCYKLLKMIEKQAGVRK
ncbi:zf-CCHC domain-containing protein [Tanacetum coccineum]